jgi:hypothetical protein
VKALAFRRVSGPTDYFVVLQTTKDPERGEWDDYMAELELVLSQPGPTVPLLIATDGGSPNGAQREQLARLVTRRGRTAMSHVFGNSAVLRLVVNAFLWIARERAEFHAPAAFSQVCDAHEVTARDALAQLADLQRDFAPVEVLKLITAGIVGSTGIVVDSRAASHRDHAR